MSSKGDKAVLISRNISELLSAEHHFEQLLPFDPRREEDINVMLGCAEQIKEAADSLYASVLSAHFRYHSR